MQFSSAGQVGLTITPGTTKTILSSLRPGQVLLWRIINNLGDNRFLVSFLGTEVIAASKFSFKPGQKISVQVKSLKQGIQMSLLTGDASGTMTTKDMTGILGRPPDAWDHIIAGSLARFKLPVNSQLLAQLRNILVSGTDIGPSGALLLAGGKGWLMASEIIDLLAVLQFTFPSLATGFMDKWWAWLLSDNPWRKWEAAFPLEKRKKYSRLVNQLSINPGEAEDTTEAVFSAVMDIMSGKDGWNGPKKEADAIISDPDLLEELISGDETSIWPQLMTIINNLYPFGLFMPLKVNISGETYTWMLRGNTKAAPEKPGLISCMMDVTAPRLGELRIIMEMDTADSLLLGKILCKSSDSERILNGKINDLTNKILNKHRISSVFHCSLADENAWTDSIAGSSFSGGGFTGIDISV